MPTWSWWTPGPARLAWQAGTLGSLTKPPELSMAKLPTRQLHVDRQSFDLTVLTARQRSTENTQRTAISQYVREQMAKLGGLVDSLAVDNREIRLSWRPETPPPTQSEHIIDMLKKGEVAPAVLLM